MNIQDTTTLNNGQKMPWLGFGTYLIPEGEAIETAVQQALDAGYRSIDTASFYENEVGVGKAIQQSNVSREDIFLTTKVWTADIRAKRVLDAFEESMNRLNQDYVDLYLVHWPVKGAYLDAWKDLETIYKSGRARAIGVSNFTIQHLQEVMNRFDVVPAVNQVEFHPYLQQPDLVQFCNENKIQFEAWSPLKQGQITSISALEPIAEQYGKTPAQVVLRWNLQKGIVTIPKSVTPSRIIENAALFDFEILDEDMAKIDALDQASRIGPDPDNFDF